jgi:2-oxoglutarate dehydrogenase E1 component
VDNETEVRWLGLSQVATPGSRIEIIDSFLSEAAAMGFEYGYSCRNHNALTIWEGQFGDFCNGAQVIIDQFLVSGESKWCQSQGLVLYLPHGYEGQGPEHSSGRLERFLQLAAEGNIQVCLLTNAAQLFHALRRQVKRNFRKPLVIMTPKSFLRSPKASTDLQALAQGQFEEILGDPRDLDPAQVERLVLCAGKVALDAFAHAENTENTQRLSTNRTAIIRLEQVYPLHAEKLRAALSMYPKAKQVFWVQEEPQNMGAYHMVRDELEDVLKHSKLKTGLRYIGRSRRASPAVGSPKTHAKEFAALMDAIFQASESTLIENG